jgi:hypothetical protein
MNKPIQVLETYLNACDAENWFLKHGLTKNSLKGYRPGTPCILYYHNDIVYLPRGITFSKCSSQDMDCLQHGCMGHMVAGERMACCLHPNLDHVQMLCAAVTKEEFMVMLLE